MSPVLKSAPRKLAKQPLMESFDDLMFVGVKELNGDSSAESSERKCESEFYY
jgi:hypothetical protein